MTVSRPGEEWRRGRLRSRGPRPDARRRLCQPDRGRVVARKRIHGSAVYAERATVLPTGDIAREIIDNRDSARQRKQKGREKVRHAPFGFSDTCRPIRYSWCPRTIRRRYPPATSSGCVGCDLLRRALRPLDRHGAVLPVDDRVICQTRFTLARLLRSSYSDCAWHRSESLKAPPRRGDRKGPNGVIG